MPEEEEQEQEERQEEEEHSEIEQEQEQQEEVTEDIAVIVAAMAVTLANQQALIDSQASRLDTLESLLLDHTANHSAPKEEEQGEEAEIEESRVSPIPSHFMHKLPKIFW